VAPWPLSGESRSAARKKLCWPVRARKGRESLIKIAKLGRLPTACLATFKYMFDGGCGGGGELTGARALLGQRSPTVRFNAPVDGTEARNAPLRTVGATLKGKFEPFTTRTQGQQACPRSLTTARL
jgi:hypothetical protein